MDSISNSVNDPLNLVEKIVFEVKSQGLFDRFRKECIADVDTKPAYQNLRQRVESSVTNYLKDQNWSADLNKNHLRDKLRKQVTESGFLETGVERIVDQVVNPKITTTFLPQVEDIVCKYLGIDKLPYKVAPTFKFSPSVELKIETDLLPTDLEAVSPDSEKSESNFETKPSPPSNIDQNDSGNDKIEEFESPPFEPLFPTTKAVKEESNDSNMSVISGLTSQDSVTSEKEIDIQQSNFEHVEEKPTNMLLEPQDTLNLITQASPDDQLSQVSSDSRLSILTHSNSSKSGIIETELPENTNSIEPSSTNTLPESSQHTFIDIKNEFEKTIIKDNIVEKLEVESSCNEESTSEINNETVEAIGVMIAKEQIQSGSVDYKKDIFGMKKEVVYSKETPCNSQELGIVANEPQLLEEIKLPIWKTIQGVEQTEIKSSPHSQHFLQEDTSILSTANSPADIKSIFTKEVLVSAAEYNIEPSPKLYQEGSSDSISDITVKPMNSYNADSKSSKSDYRNKVVDDLRRSDSKSSGSRYSKSYSNDRDKGKHRSRERSRDRKYSSSNSSRYRSDRDSKYDYSRSRTNTPDKSKSSTSRSRSSKKYSSGDKSYDKKKYKTDDHSSSRNKHQDKRRSTDNDSNDGSNDGYLNSRSNSSSNHNGGSSQSNTGSNSTSYTTNSSVSTTNAATDNKQSDRDYKKEVYGRSRYESASSRNYDSRYSSSSSSKRRYYESSSHGSSSKSKKSRTSREEDLLYFPDKNSYYKSKGDKFLQFASDLRKQCKSYHSSIFLSDTNGDYVKLLQRKHDSVVNFVNDAGISLNENKLESTTMRNARSGHHINKKLFRENNQINLNFLQRNMMKFDDIITNEKVLFQINSNTVLEGINKQEKSNVEITKNHISPTIVNPKSQQNISTPNELAAVNVNNNSVTKAFKPKISQKSSQTYSNEDLYKPRNVFGQRSRRRGLNNDDIF